MILSGKTRLAGVLGWPVSHSKSPRLHNWWLERLGIDGAYVPLAVAPERFEQVVRALPFMGFAGCNVTVPHKEAALALADIVDPVAHRIGAANTLVFQPDGTIEARNTDGFGFMENLRQGAPHWDPAAAPAVVLGAGGAARAVCVSLLDAGAPEIRLANRTRGRCDALAAELGGAIRVIDWPVGTAGLDGAGLLVNTTSLGMVGQPPLAVDLSPLPQSALVTDIVYAPVETDLLRLARQAGHPTVDGLGMLLHQARSGFAAWFGAWPEVTEDLRRFVLAT
jgi:shikimate dehydrogenase